jgi:hypothetical protein
MLTPLNKDSYIYGMTKKTYQAEDATQFAKSLLTRIIEKTELPSFSSVTDNNNPPKKKSYSKNKEKTNKNSVKRRD